MSDYFAAREDLTYYRVAAAMIKSFPPQESILDVGSANVPFVAMFPNIRDRTVIDLRPQLKLAEVTEATVLCGDFTGYPFHRKYAVVTCMQVLEHVPAPRSFVDRLFSLSTKLVLISVPWRWPKGACRFHLHDPIDDTVMRGWTRERIPQATQLVEDDRVLRKIFLYRVDSEYLTRFATPTPETTSV